MPFRECSLVSQREEFCRLAVQPGSDVRALCRRFGVSPTTGYKWLHAYRDHGVAGLSDGSRRPHHSPGRTPDDLEARVMAVRLEHPAWGGRKIRRVLENEGLAHPPAASTITQIIRRHGALGGPGAGEARGFVRFEHAEPNALWQMDFKGAFALERGQCHPLTVLDDHSRYSLAIGACGDQQGETVRARMESVFRRYGLPWRILTDNGPPWGSAGHGEHSRLSVWFMDLGIGVVHGRPYHPQTQGKEERFHRTLKAELLDGRAFRTLAEAQAAFDAWRPVYNAKRPHEALGLRTPADRYRMSPRPMPDSIAPPDYEPQSAVRTVDATGRIAFKGRSLRTSKAFAGKRVALRATEQDGLFDICYRTHRLGQIDLRHDPAQPVHHVPEHPSTLSPV